MNQVIRNVAGAATLMLAAGSVAAGNLAVSRQVVVDRSPATVRKLYELDQAARQARSRVIGDLFAAGYAALCQLAPRLWNTLVRRARRSGRVAPA